MNKRAVRLHVLCCIGPHLVAAFISLRYDIKSWYGTVSATAVVLTVFLAFINNDFSFRGATHVACIFLGVISQEVSRQPRSIDWNRLADAEHLGFYMFFAHLAKGIGSLLKLLPTVSVINSRKSDVASWRDFVGWSLSIISSFYFLQEPNIYRNDKGMAEWRFTFAKMETLHWVGLALSASSDYKYLGWFLVAFNSIQSLLTHHLFQQLIT